MGRLADDCEAILRSLVDAPLDGQSLRQIAADTGLKATEIVDLIASHLGGSVESHSMRFRGTRETRYSLKCR